MAYRIETTHDPDRGGWLAEIYDDAGEFIGCAIADTEGKAVERAAAMVREAEQYD
jgi:hypothetical protein